MTIDPSTDIDHVLADTVAYRRALGAFATGVCVVTAEGASGPLGITINSFTSVSLKPRLVLWCLDAESERQSTFATADRFSIHVLRADDRDRANRFAKGDWMLSERDFTPDAARRPILPHTLARFDCIAHDRIPMGDHLTIIGRVENYQAVDGDGLTYFRGRYGRAPDPLS